MKKIYGTENSCTNRIFENYEIGSEKRKQEFEPFVLSQYITNQKKFSLQQTIKRRQRWQNSATFSLMIGIRGDVLVEAMKQAQREHLNEQNLARRSREIRNVDFNLNTLSELEIIKDFRFQLPEI